MNAADVMKRETRRYSVINEVAKALDEIAALEADARKQAELIIAEAESKAAQIVADALNEAKVMTDEVKTRLDALEDIARNKTKLNGEDYIRTVGYQKFDDCTVAVAEKLPLY